MNECLYMYVCMYLYVCMYVRMYVCMYVCMYMYRLSQEKLPQTLIPVIAS